MNVVSYDDALVGGARSVFTKDGSGKWAGDRFLAAIEAGRGLSPTELRTLSTLREDEWKEFDNVLVRAGAIRLRFVAALIAAGLVKRIANGMAKTMLQYEKVSDMDDAGVSLDGIAQTLNEGLVFTPANIPLPITHKDWFLNLRVLAASRNGGESLDTTQTALAGRKIGEKTEYMAVRGGPQFGGAPIYGLLNHPDRNTVSFSGGLPWSDAGKTGAQVLTDVATWKAALEADRFYGPYWIVLPSDASGKLAEDYKAATSNTIRSRIMEIDNIAQVIFTDQMPTANAVMMQATPDVIEMVEGEPLQTIQWDTHGGMQVHFKGMTIMVPLIKSDIEGRSGIAHAS